MSQSPRIAILPYEAKLGLLPGAFPLDKLVWPLGTPEGIVGKALRDLGPEDHLLVYPRKSHYWRFGFGTRAKVSIMVLEPRVIHGGHMDLLQRAYGRFHKVLASDEALLGAIPNGVFFPAGGCWVPGWRDLERTKCRNLSLIASEKRSQEGHRLRHRMVDWARGSDVDMDALGRGYNALADKSEALAPYRFSVVIENIQERNYFTEKLVDAILCRTVPIYWGCPNIADFFDTSGMIVCEDEASLRAAVLAASEDGYAARIPALEALVPVAADYGDFYTRAARAVMG
ncbi:hypothetical protein KUD11_02165 [Roseovarius sp. LXJ103]|uniref:glycosyltransferase family 10 domain-containing protein n=1 Tax=Roseovarius carneus TaxID=2853164 RepID=UPI000D608197|nr:glycosyltransferase family 10 [Roseovarius carneus]MBZ8117444.1 hypothetical protein [Roseovarius carneus]PWE37376.1 hypothetical protein DD563_12775 [Pelagicola sp. LXJ1103]